MYIHVHVYVQHSSMVEEEGAERLAEISRELQQIKEHNKALQIQLDNAEVHVHVYMNMLYTHAL